MLQSGVIGKHTRKGVVRFESSKEQLALPARRINRRGILKMVVRNLPFDGRKVC